MNIEEFVTTSYKDKLAKLKKVNEVNSFICCSFDNLIISSANETHIKEVAELWANLASIQQVYAPERYDFKAEGKNWQDFVRRKLSKKHNLLLVAYEKDCTEIKGFLYLQTITLPSSDLVVKGVIEDIYTKPQYRNNKIASYLLDVSLDWASKQTIKQVEFISLSKSKGINDFHLNFLKVFKREVKLEFLSI